MHFDDGALCVPRAECLLCLHQTSELSNSRFFIFCWNNISAKADTFLSMPHFLNMKNLGKGATVSICIQLQYVQEIL